METLSPALTYKQNLGLKGKLIHYLLTALRLSNQPAIKLYRSYGTASRLTIQGHAFRVCALPRSRYRHNIIVNVLAVIRLFLVKPYPMGTVRVHFAGQSVEVQTDETGFFRYELPLNQPVSPGWHSVQADLVSQMLPIPVILASGEGQVLVPHPTRLACISDIDDTFLISHSSTIAKRLFVLLTQNAHSRMPFEGVVSHYQLLAQADSGAGTTNPFFYVSSSEWNLYDYIMDFSRRNGLPDGIYLLSPLKQLGQVLQTGKGKHLTKFDRIGQIIDTYPTQQFILLGDDSQQDPFIYASVVERYPGQIGSVYIRQIHAQNQPATRQTIQRIEAAGVPCCYFAHSAEAKQHSIRTGLITS